MKDKKEEYSIGLGFVGLIPWIVLMVGSAYLIPLAESGQIPLIFLLIFLIVMVIFCVFGGAMISRFMPPSSDVIL